MPAADALCSSAGLRLADGDLSCVYRVVVAQTKEAPAFWTVEGASCGETDWQPVHSGYIHGRYLFRTEKRSGKYQVVSVARYDMDLWQ